MISSRKVICINLWNWKRNAYTFIAYNPPDPLKYISITLSVLFIFCNSPWDDIGYKIPNIALEIWYWERYFLCIFVVKTFRAIQIKCSAFQKIKFRSIYLEYKSFLDCLQTHWDLCMYSVICRFWTRGYYGNEMVLWDVFSQNAVGFK